MKPMMIKERMDVIDLLRGFALIGLPFVNVIGIWIGSLELSGTKTDVMIQRFLYLFVEGRFYSIFSFLFGLGFWIFLSRAERKNDRPYILFIRRMVILFIFGVLHQLLQPGEALLVYAILGLFILIFYKLPKQVNLFIGIVGVVIGSVFAAKLLLPLPLMMLGLACGQYRIFEMYEEHRKRWMGVAFVSLIATWVCSFLLWQKAPEMGLASLTNGDLQDAQIASNILFHEFAKQSMKVGVIFSLLYVSVVVLLEPIMKHVLVPINTFGRMALTNYIGQSVLLVLVLLLKPAGMVFSYSFAVVTCALIVTIQIVISVFWLKVFKYGPLEWVWRCATYGQLLSIRR